MPHYNHRKEYESTLSEFRVQAGLTVRELCKIIGITTTSYSELNSGVEAPFYKDGQVKPAVSTLSM